jgi:hypothetical protein
VILVLGDSAANRRLVHQLKDALGADFQASNAAILTVLSAVGRLPGSGVLLL